MIPFPKMTLEIIVVYHYYRATINTRLLKWTGGHLLTQTQRSDLYLAIEPTMLYSLFIPSYQNFCDSEKDYTVLLIIKGLLIEFSILNYGLLIC